MTAITIDEVTKRFGDTTALQTVDCNIEEGEIFGLLGPNGAGKTTLFRCMLGLYHADAGEIDVAGVRVSDDPIGVKEKVAYLPAQVGFYEQMSARQNLSYFASLAGTDPDIEALLERVGLADDADTKVRGFSTGMVKRLGIAQALLRDPEVMILDEPTDGLDPDAKQQFQELIQEVNEEDGVTIILSSHILPELEPVCDRIGILNEGQLIAVGDPDELELKEGTTVVLEVTDMDALESVLTEAGYVAERDEDRIRVSGDDLSPGEVYEVVKESDVVLEALHRESQTLEQVYMDYTRGDA